MKLLQGLRPRWRFAIWLALSLLLTFVWWNLQGRFIAVGNINLGLALFHGAPILLNLALANRLGLLGPQTSGPATVGMVLTSVALPHILLFLVLTVGCLIAASLGQRGACL